MTTAALPAHRTISWRALILPREHGSWSLALEPLALGLIAAPSGPGSALALSAAAIFLARRPWQAARAGDARLGFALSALTLLGLIALLALVAGVHYAQGPAGIALAAAIPAAAAFAWFDRRKAGRAAAAELAGATCFAVFPVAIALAGGRAWPLAVVLGGFALARSTTSILALRTFLRRRKGETVTLRFACGVAIASAVAFVSYAWQGGSWLPAVWTIVFAGRVAWLFGRFPPQWTARQLGMLEAVGGVLAIITTGIALR